MSNPRQIREEITKKIIAALEKDLLPWRRPWASNNAGQHSNASTKKSYRGVNPLLLQIHAALFGFTFNLVGHFQSVEIYGLLRQPPSR